MFGFRRGQRLREIQPRKPGGMYEMASVLREGETIDPNTVVAPTRAAAALNADLGASTRV